MVNQIQILKALIDDAEEILGLQKLAYRSEAKLYNSYDILPLTQTIDEIKSQFGTHVLLKAVFDRSFVGTVRAYEKDGTCFIGRLAVHPDMQNQGIGKALMREIERFFTCHRFELFTGSKSVKNIYLYQKLGYVIFKKEKYECGGIEVVFMEKGCKP